ncbi:unnamed protein product [Toxocara canis]|uniref:5-oxoprolinase n=1 Tax=Toxocara canis TaxID=6265 RepID=A0A183V0I4_TOXCA|nr:unnamed protein product [Toxocara canis]
MKTRSGFGFAIDRGGTFTDVYVKKPDGSCRVLKLLSEDFTNYRDAPTEAIRRVLEEELHIKIPRGCPVPTDNISWIRMGTTVATNALLERKGERCALLITKGFKDLLYIGNQTRPSIFEFDICLPDVLYEEVIEVDERVIVADDTCQLDLNAPKDQARNLEEVFVEKAVDEGLVKQQLKWIYDKGIRSLAVVFLHSYKYPNHEKQVGEIAAKMGFSNISLSSDVMPMIKIVPRGYTACADAYLTPKIRDYINSFNAGFIDDLKGVRVEFMQSDGGLCPVEKFFGSRAILSGPAAGVVGVSLTAYDALTKQPIIGFDMGGTSTDVKSDSEVSRYAGSFAHVMETAIAGVTIQAPQVNSLFVYSVQ